MSPRMLRLESANTLSVLLPVVLMIRRVIESTSDCRRSICVVNNLISERWSLSIFALLFSNLFQILYQLHHASIQFVVCRHTSLGTPRLLIPYPSMIGSADRCRSRLAKLEV
jgi:hypothetical protein